MKDVIITGCPRTGTTALCSLLYHSNGVILTNELSCYHRNRTTMTDALGREEKPHLDRCLQLKGWTYQNLIDHIDGTWRDEDIQIFGDKNPDYCCNTFLPRHVSDLYPEARFIFTHRDPCATAWSFLRRSLVEKDTSAAWYVEDIEEALDIIIKYTLNWATLIYPRVKNKKIIVYEDYSQDVDALVRELSDFLDFELDINKPEELYFPTNVDSWKNELAPVDIQTIRLKFKPIEEYIRSLSNGV